MNIYFFKSLAGSDEHNDGCMDKHLFNIIQMITMSVKIIHEKSLLMKFWHFPSKIHV